MLHVVTYNILFGKRLPGVVSWITSQHDADVVCLQEFPASKCASFYRSLPKGMWGHRFTNSFILKKKTFGIITLFKRKNLKLIKTKILHMGVHPMEKIFLGNPMEKSCLVTTFKSGSKTVTVANTHLVFLAANQSRYKQIRYIADQLASYDHALIITGDFNLHCIKINKKLIRLMKTFGFHTPFMKLATHHFGIVKHQLDYVFSARCKIISLEAPRITYSDHYPVIAQVAL